MPSWLAMLWKSLGPKARFSWREPKKYRRIVEMHKRTRERWWVRVRNALLGGGFMMAAWLVARLNADPAKTPPPVGWAIFAALVFALVWGYLYPWFISVLDSEISVYDHGIVRSHGKETILWRFANLWSYEWLPNDGFATLVLQPREGQQILIGVPTTIPESDFRAFLDARFPEPKSSYTSAECSAR